MGNQSLALASCGYSPRYSYRGFLVNSHIGTRPTAMFRRQRASLRAPGRLPLVLEAGGGRQGLRHLEVEIF